MSKNYVGITQPLNIVSKGYSNLDSKYGPYKTKQEALENIPLALRKEGLTVGIIVEGTVKEYWFNSGIENVNLIEKTSGGDYTQILTEIAKKVNKEPGKFLMTQAERDFIELIATGGGPGSNTDIAVLKGLFLSKLEEDIAEQKITFDKGLKSSGLAELTDTYFGEFSSGIHTGKGGAIDKDGHSELESLIVRSFLEVPELRYNKLSLIGEEVAVGAGGVIEEVSPIAGVLGKFRIKLKLQEGELNPFWYDDIIKGIYHHDNGFQTTFGRIVSSTDANSPFFDIILRPSSGNITYPAPVPFMHIARWGNFNSNPSLDTSDRQSLLIISAKTGSITIYDGMKDYSGGYINSKWGKPVGLEFIPNIENLGLDPNDPILYLKTLLVQDIVKVSYQGAPIIEYRDRGIWDLAIAQGDSPYRNTMSVKDEVWHNKIKYRCLVDKNSVEPSENNSSWLFLFKIEDGLSNIDIIFSPESVILKADNEDIIENYNNSYTNIKLMEGSLELTPLLINETKVDGSYWIHSSTGTGISPGTISKNFASNSLDASNASALSSNTASIRWEIRGKRHNGEEFTRVIVQRFIVVQDGKGLQISIKGSVETFGETFPNSPINGNKHLKTFDSKVYTWNGTIWNPSVESIPGDAWVVNQDGHIYIWDGSSWNDSGEFKGDPGANAIVHFAYADIVLYDTNSEQYVPVEGGFTLDDYADKVWLGVYWDYISQDSTDSKKYNWTKVKGEKGDKGENGTSVSIKGKVGNPSLLPEIDNNLGDGYISEDTGSLWTFDGQTQDTYLDSNSVVQNAIFGWLNAGQIKGESSYIHVAWADNVTFTGSNVFQSVSGFTTINTNKKRWYGIYIDEIKEDAPVGQASKYVWTDTKGEAGKDSKAEEFIFIRNNTNNFSTIPNSPQVDDHVPTGWTDNPTGVTASLKYEWVSVRKYRNEQWQAFSTPSLWNIYVTDGEDGEDGKDSKSDEFIYFRSNNPNFGIASNRPGTSQVDDYVPTTPTGWTDNPSGVTEAQQYEYVSKREFRNNTWSLFSIPSLWAKWSQDAKNPYSALDTNPTSPYYNNGKKYWFIWNHSIQSYINSGDPSQGDDGNAPRINASGYWEVWGSLQNGTFGYIATTVRAKGIDGKDSKAEEFIFTRNNISDFTTIPGTSQTDKFVPTGWTDDPVGVTAALKYEWVSLRKFNGTTWGTFSKPSIWNIYVVNGKDGINGIDGEDGKDSLSDEFIYIRNNNAGFGVIGNKPPSAQTQDYVPTGWSDDPLGVNSTLIYEWVCKRIYRNNSWSDFSIPSLWSRFSKDGNTGVSITSVTEYYLASNLNSGINTNNSGWKTTLQTLTPVNKYLWNYEKVNFSDTTSQNTTPVIIGVYGDTGRSITSVEERYLTSALATGVTRATSGWSTTMQVTTPTNKYLWNYEIVNWNVAPLVTYVEPVIIGTHGTKGDKGDKGDNADPTAVAAPYMAGEWQGSSAGNGSSTKIYFRSDDVYPVVSYLKSPTDKPIYYFLKNKVVLPIGSPKPTIDTTNWKLADGYELVIVEALFSQFAKLGSFIFNGQKMISQEGILAGVSSNNYKATGFIPNFEVDGKTGILKAKNAEISGNITSRTVITGNSLNKITLNEEEDNLLKFRHSNGVIAAEFGVINGNSAMIWYDESGAEIWRAGRDGIVYKTYVSEKWIVEPIHKVPGSIGYPLTGTNLLNMENYFKTLLQNMPVGQNPKTVSNTTIYKYYAGINSNSEARKQYEGYYTQQSYVTPPSFPVTGWYTYPNVLLMTQDSPAKYLIQLEYFDTTGTVPGGVLVQNLRRAYIEVSPEIAP